MVHTVSEYTARYIISSPLYTKETNRPGYEQLYFDSADATTKRLKTQSNQGFMADQLQRLDEMLRQVNPFAQSRKRMHQME
jgi:hypothetical protein